MKVFLSSSDHGNNPQDLSDLVAPPKRMGVIRNSLDFSTEIQRLADGLEAEFRALRAIGIEPEAIDLRDYFGQQSNLEQKINSLNGVWVVGGNTFILRRAMRYSGLDSILQAKRNDPSFVYAGYSAGSCVAGSSLRGIDYADDPEFTPPKYSPDVIWEGLGLVNFSIAPHYRSDHPESEMIEDTVKYFEKYKVPHIKLHDGEVYIGEAV